MILQINAQILDFSALQLICVLPTFEKGLKVTSMLTTLLANKLF